MALRLNKRRLRRRMILALAGIVLAGLLFVSYQWWRWERTRSIRYPEFGIVIPGGYSLHGIDVSKYQSRIAWQEVGAMKVKEVQLRFAFIKATEGTSNIDPYFIHNWKKSKGAGLVRGAYHFFIASADGKVQARHFARQVDLQPGDLPPVLDVEQLNGTNPVQLQQQAMAWLQETEKIFGVRPILYTNVDFYRRYLGSAFDGYPLWVAHYYQPGKPQIGRDWHFWQHSDKGHVNGIRGEVDFNVFNGSMEDLQRLLIH